MKKWICPYCNRKVELKKKNIFQKFVESRIDKQADKISNGGMFPHYDHYCECKAHLTIGKGKIKDRKGKLRDIEGVIISGSR